MSGIPGNSGDCQCAYSRLDFTLTMTTGLSLVLVDSELSALVVARDEDSWYMLTVYLQSNLSSLEGT